MAFQGEGSLCGYSHQRYPVDKGLIDAGPTKSCCPLARVPPGEVAAGCHVQVENEWRGKLPTPKGVNEES